MVLHQVKNWQNWKMQGCFMQFLRLIFVRKLQGALPPDPTRGVAPWIPTGGLLWPPGPHFSADFSILNSRACILVQNPQCVPDYLYLQVAMASLFTSWIIVKQLNEIVCSGWCRVRCAGHAVQPWGHQQPGRVLPTGGHGQPDVHPKQIKTKKSKHNKK